MNSPEARAGGDNALILHPDSGNEWGEAPITSSRTAPRCKERGRLELLVQEADPRMVQIAGSRTPPGVVPPKVV